MSLMVQPKLGRRMHVLLQDVITKRYDMKAMSMSQFIPSPRPDGAASPNGQLRSNHSASAVGKPNPDDSTTPAKPKVVVLGCGWGGFNFLKDVDKSKFDVHVISPTNHFLFTPLLPSSAVGTLEFRAIQEPVRTIQGIDYSQGKAQSVNLEKRSLEYQDIFKNGTYTIDYDYLVLACGSKTNTFGTPGVQDRLGKEVFFLKQLHHSREIRNRILECFERAAIMHQNNEAEERNRLLSFVVVGGGPTSCEFVGELYDFITEDVSRWYPDLRPFIKVTLVEASGKLLGTFESKLGSYVLSSFKSRKIDIKLDTAVKEFKDHRLTVLSDGTEIPTGMMVWSAGLQQISFVQESLGSLEKGPTQRLLMDDYLRIPDQACGNRVLALGDCAVNTTSPLPPLAQSARLQGKWLAKAMNQSHHPADPDLLFKGAQPFEFFSLGSMASVGGWKGVLDFSHVGSNKSEYSLGSLSGFLGFLTWRFAYLGRQVSITNKILIPMYWFKAFVFGRDISRF